VELALESRVERILLDSAKGCSFYAVPGHVSRDKTRCSVSFGLGAVYHHCWWALF
jgi:hypothetical protein